MSTLLSAGSLALRMVVLGIVFLAASAVPAAGQETVCITVPSTVSFPVTDVTRSTSGAPNPTTKFFEREPAVWESASCECAGRWRWIYTAERFQYSGVERLLDQSRGKWRDRMEWDARVVLLHARVPK